MNADEIRNSKQFTIQIPAAEDGADFWLREIAAQVAELNVRLVELESAIRLGFIELRGTTMCALALAPTEKENTKNEKASERRK
jgi:hypothetical protein